MATCKELIRIFQIIEQYHELESVWVLAEHDILYLPLSEDDGITDDHIKELKELGCFVDHDSESWATWT